MTAVIVLVLCLNTQCVERPILPIEPLSPFACAIHGQQAGAEWLAQHPFLAARGWRLAKWRGQMGQRAERRA